MKMLYSEVLLGFYYRNVTITLRNLAYIFTFPHISTMWKVSKRFLLLWLSYEPEATHYDSKAYLPW